MPSILVIVRDAGPGLADTLCSLDGLRRAGWDDVVVAVPSEQAACAAIVADFGARVVIGGPPDGEAVLRNRAAAACASERSLLLEAGERWLDSGDTLAVLEALETGAVGIMRHTSTSRALSVQPLLEIEIYETPDDPSACAPASTWAAANPEWTVLTRLTAPEAQHQE